MLLGYDDEGRGVMISNEGNFVNPLLYHLEMLNLPSSTVCIL